MCASCAARTFDASSPSPSGGTWGVKTRAQACFCWGSGGSAPRASCVGRFPPSEGLPTTRSSRISTPGRAIPACGSGAVWRALWMARPPHVVTRRVEASARPRTRPAWGSRVYRPCVPEPYGGLFPCQTDHPPCHGGSRSASRFASFLGCPECPVWPGFSPDEGERSAPRGPPAHAPHGVGTMPGRWAGGRGPRRCTACVAWDAQAAGGHRLHKDPRPRPGRPALGRGGRTAHNYLASVQVMSDRTRPPGAQ